MTTFPFIQTLPVPGFGQKIYPDQVMDGGTRALIDTTDPWSWGGAVPTEGETVAIGNGPLNYALARDGWVEDKALVATAIEYSKKGLSMGGPDRLRLPVGFKPRVTDTHLLLTWWMKNELLPTGSGFNNRIFDVREGSSSRFGLSIVYASAGVLNAVEIFMDGLSTWSLTGSNAFVAALFDGELHQFAVETERLGDGYARQKLYLDGLLANDRGLVTDSTGAWGDTGAITSMAFGLPISFGGTGLNGKLYNAAMHMPAPEYPRTMADVVATDYEANVTRLTAASA